MKIKNSLIPIIIVALIVVTIVSGILYTPTVTAQKNGQNSTVTGKNPFRRSKDLPRLNKDQIPDSVAYELFLRTVGEYNAKGLVERAGFSEEQTAVIVGEARSLNEALTFNDEIETRLKRSNALTTSNKEQIKNVQAKKRELLNRTINRFLVEGLLEDGKNKLQEFIDAEVKDSIVVVQKPRLKGEVAFVKASAKLSNQSAENLYLYSTGWQEGVNIFGAGTLSEQNPSGTSYRVTTTVTSPSGRANTTTGDWNFATVSNNTGLSMGVEDGSYSIQSSYELAEGYYDEYGTFVETGSSTVGNSFNSVNVAPAIVLGSAILTPPQVTLGGGVRTIEVSATLSATQSVPEGTAVDFELLETANPSNIGYSVLPGTQQGPTPSPSGSRQVRKIIPNSGRIETIDNLYELTLSNVSTGNPTGTVTNQLRINRIIVPRGGNGGVQGENSQVPAVFSILPLPTPTPSPSPTGGSGGWGVTSTCYFNGGGGGVYGCAPGYGTGFNGSGSPTAGGSYCCQYASPLLLDIEGNGFAMTDYYEGVPFDVAGKGYASQTSWTAANSDDAWLVLDRNENGRIDNGTEMFGDASEQLVSNNPRNGFSSLAVFDTVQRGGDADGKITRRDAVFRKLRLWQDRNHNGVSEPEELSRLPALDVVALFLNYQESRRTDAFGNRFKFRAKVRDRNDSRVGRWAWDVFLVNAPPNSNAVSCLLRE